MANITRRSARRIAMQVLYAMELQGEIKAELCDKYLSSTPLDEKDITSQRSYIEKIVKGVCDNLDTIDAKINEVSEGWPVERIAATEREIIRIAIYEITNGDDVPAAVAINEAVELAKAFCDEKSSRFVNAVLAKVQ